MRILLTNEEALAVLYQCFTDGGLSEIGRSDIELDFNEIDYAKAKLQLLEINNKEFPCYEDVLIQIVRNGGALTFNDHNDDGKGHVITLPTLKHSLSREINGLNKES